MVNKIGTHRYQRPRRQQCVTLGWLLRMFKYNDTPPSPLLVSSFPFLSSRSNLFTSLPLRGRDIRVCICAKYPPILSSFPSPPPPSLSPHPTDSNPLPSPIYQNKPLLSSTLSVSALLLNATIGAVPVAV